MSVTYRLFQRWTAKKKIPSAAEGCAALGLERQAATYWKSGRNAEAHIIERMAIDLGEEPAGYILAANAEKVRNSDERTTLLRTAKRLGYAALLFLVPTVGTLSIM